jgi:UDP-N-acetylglucosamine 4,6-dehydratase/5-epimerase
MRRACFDPQNGLAINGRYRNCIMFDGKILLITGGTGSFGNAVLRRFLKTGIAEIRIFSRDEKKQDDQRRQFQSPKLKYYIGDVRDYRTILTATRGVDYIFHAAALKQVPSCEFHPMEAVQTNVIGTDNMLEAAIANRVKRVVCLSTDKAVYPVNAMGVSKAMMEKVFIAKSRNVDPAHTVICGTRYGNVLASRGSVVPLFVSQIRAKAPITVTDPNMTRFIMSLEEAVDLVLFAFEHGRNGDMFVKKAPAVKIGILARAVAELMGVPDYPIKVIGTRHGEKRYETLLSREELVNSTDLGDFFRVPPDNRDLNYASYFDVGEQKLSDAVDYNSDNSGLIDVAATKEKIAKLRYMRGVLAGENPEEDQ